MGNAKDLTLGELLRMAGGGGAGLQARNDEKGGEGGKRAGNRAFVTVPNLDLDV